MQAVADDNMDRSLIDNIDWDMTPEKAIETYLEWGSGWSRKGKFVSYTGMESLYFVVYDWDDPPQVTLIRRNVKEMEEIAKIEVPPELFRASIEEAGRKPGVGVCAPNAALIRWLQDHLGA